MNITAGNPVRRGKRIKARTLAASAQPSIDASQTIQGMPLLAAGSASSTQALIDTFQTRQGMPLLAAGSGEPGALSNVNENTQNHPTLWEQLAPWPGDWEWNGQHDETGIVT